VKPYIPYDIVYGPVGTLPALPLLPEHLDSSAVHSESSPLKVPSWIVEADVPDRRVVFEDTALTALRGLVRSREVQFCRDEEEAVQLVVQVLRQDVRSIHQGRGSSEGPSAKLYHCTLDGMRLSFSTSESEIRVQAVTSTEGKREA